MFLLIFDYRYVLRRILRRCVRFGTEKLNVPPGFIASLVTVAVNTLVSNLTIAQCTFNCQPCYFIETNHAVHASVLCCIKVYSQSLHHYWLTHFVMHNSVIKFEEKKNMIYHFNNSSWAKKISHHLSCHDFFTLQGDFFPELKKDPQLVSRN